MSKIHENLINILMWSVAFLMPACVLAQAEGFLQVTVPEYSGPLTVSPESYPQLAAHRTQAFLDLDSMGYIEEEYLVSGNANVYEWAVDGSVSVKIPAAPYTTRILIRRPVDPGRFSGNVIVETLNNARQYDWAFVWALSYDYIVNSGDVFVAVTHSPDGIGVLKNFDSLRYASLTLANPAPMETCGPDNSTSASEEGLKWDLISQIGVLLRSETGPLAGFEVKSLVATTHTEELTTYANSIHKFSKRSNGDPVYDGFVIKSEYAATDRISRCALPPPEGDQRRIIRNAGVPVLRVITQGDVLGALSVRREDSDDPSDLFRLWEVAGAPHMDKIYYQHMPVVEDQVKFGQVGYLVNWPMAYQCTPDIDLLDFPVMRYAVNAAFSAMTSWINTGASPPRAERISVSRENSGEPDIVTDSHGNALGGMRNVYLDVPVATYMDSSPGPAVCTNLGRKEIFSWQKLESLYGNSENYASRVDQRLESLVENGWLTNKDSEKIRQELIP
jgi:hypothetical protein